MKILIGYDGSTFADAALDDLRWAGLPREAEALLLSVVDLEQRLPFRDWEELRSITDLAVERLRGCFPGWEARAEVRPGAAASEIVSKANEWESELVVVGSQGLSAIGRFLLGSVSQEVVNKAPCTVRIGRSRPDRNGSPLRVAVCTDGSADADAAVRAAANRGWPAHTEACVIAALNSPWSVTQTKEWYYEKIEAAVSDLRAAGLTASSIVKEGDPQNILLGEIEKWRADCVFIGSRGLGRVMRFLLGSVSAAVAAHAQCSVEVTREKETKS
jgi:nucleotide-binding universal stress UspA family protein